MFFGELFFEFEMMGIVYINHHMHYGAADKEGQIVGMRGATRGLQVVDKDDKHVC